MLSRLVVAASLLVPALPLIACTSNDVGSRPEPPALSIESPSRGTMREGLSTVQVIGTVGASATGSPVATVTVNGAAAEVAPDGTFRATIPVHAGTNLIHTVATTADGGTADDMRGVLTGTFRPATAAVENAIAMQLSKEAFTTLGHTAESLIAQTDLNMLVMPYNPVIAKGLTNGQEDCLYGKVSVKPGLDLDHADIAIVPGDAGLALDVTIYQLYIPLHARYAAACIDADTDITIRATTARVRGTVAVNVNAGRFDVTLENPVVTFTGFDLAASGLPGAVLSLLDLNNEIAKVLADQMEKFIGPMVKDTIANIHVGPQTVTVLGKQLTAEVAAAGIGFDAAGAEMVLDATMTVAGGSHGFLFTDDQAPPVRATGFQLALADDTLNQVMSNFWSAGGLDQTLQQSLGLYDASLLDALLPPVVSIGDNCALLLSIPYLIVHLMTFEQEITTLAMNVEVDLAIAPHPGGAGNIAQVTLGTPVLHADVVADVSGIPAQGIESVMPAVIQNMIGTYTPLLQAVPLPALPGGLRVSNLHLGTADDYLVVNGDLQ